MRVTGKATDHSFIMARLHCAYVRVHARITMGLNYVWPSLISYYLSRVFGRRLRQSNTNLHLCCCCWTGFKSEEAPNIQDVIVLSKNILVNIIISVLKVRKTFLMCNVVNLLNNLFGLLPLSMPKVHGDPHLWPSHSFTYSLKVTLRKCVA